MWTSTLLPKFVIWPSEGPSILYTLFWLMSREDNEWQEKAAFLGPSSVTARIIGCRGGCPRSFWPPQRLAALQGKVASVDRRACSGIQVATSSDPRASLVGGCSSKHFRSPFGPERRRLPALGLSVNTPCAASPRRRHWRRSRAIWVTGGGRHPGARAVVTFTLRYLYATTPEHMCAPELSRFD